MARTQNSATAVIAVLSLLQPLPGLAQAKAQAPGAITEEALETTLACLKNFKGKPKDAEKACLEELKLAEVECLPELLQPDGRPDKKNKKKDASPEMIAERIVRAANAEACMADQAKVTADAEDAKKAQNAADATAQADVRAEADAKAATDLKAKEAAEADGKAQAEADAKAKKRAAAEAQAQADADASALLQTEAIAEAETAAMAEAQAKKAEETAASEAAALAAAQAEADDVAKLEAKRAKEDLKSAAKAAKADEKAAKRAIAEVQTQAEADARALVQAEAIAEAETAAIAKAEKEAQAEAEAQAKKAEETAASEAAARAAAPSRECVVELLDAAGETLCADDMTQAEITAVTAAATENTDVAVTTQTVTEETTRSSAQEFETPNAKEGGGLSNLEKAGLLALGALVVGAILQNGQKVTAKTGDRVVVQDEFGNFSVLKDDDVLLRQAGSTVRTETFSDGSTRTFVTREDGVQIITIRDSSGQVQRRTRIAADGSEVLLIDDTRKFEPIDVSALPRPAVSDLAYRDTTDQAALREALRAAESRDIGRSFSLSQVREYREVRNLALEINLDNITFPTNSAAIQPGEARQLREIGLLMEEFIATNPRELFLIEGYTDAVGDESYNLLLSDRRAETVALALSEYFGVRTENMVVQGYGERFPLIPTLEAERLNRRVTIRRITTLIQPQ
ncbi:OmpA family protein [Roseovarius gaetbuli]|nr:OmpA family protein [Roseovarius gaetbuli]